MITSNQNSRIKHLRALLTQRKEREREQAFVIEGVRLLEESFSSLCPPREVLFSTKLSGRGKQLIQAIQEQGIPIEEVSAEVMESLSDTEASQGILAEVGYCSLPIPADLSFVLVLDNLRDPGNLGTLLRTAAAAGVDAALLTPGTADPYSPKVLRSGMGAHFQLPIRSCAWEEVVEIAHQKGIPRLKLLLTEAGEGTSIWNTDLRQPLAVIVGGEADGVSEAGRRLADELITIPMPGRCESLNAAVAAAIVLFEVVRQRSPY